MIGFAKFLSNTPAVKFGDFTLKSGRKSKYFVNFGDIYKPGDLIHLGEFYAAYITNSSPDTFGDIDVIFGPPYKGISIAIATSMALYTRHRGLSIPFAYNRKTTKTHGERGDFVGADLNNKRVLIVDDVFTDGRTKLDTFSQLVDFDVEICGVLVGVDRQETTADGKTVCREFFEKNTGIKVHSLTNRDELLSLSRDKIQWEK